jgi:hypothetical protein
MDDWKNVHRCVDASFMVRRWLEGRKKAKMDVEVCGA